MADPVVADPPNLPEFDHSSEVDFAAALGSLPIPVFDDTFFSSNDSVPMDSFFPDQPLEFDDNFMLNLDDIDDFLIDDDLEVVPSDSPPKSTSPDSGSSIVLGIRDCGLDGFVNSQNSYPQKSISGGDLIHEPPDSGNCDRESSGGPVSSQGSGNCGVGSSEGQNSPVHSGNSDRDVSSSAFAGPEETGKSNLVPKRKKEADAEEEEGNSESRTPKYRRSSETDTRALSCPSPPLEEEDDKKKARLMRNRESAQLSRQRKKHYVEELEDKVRGMNSTITDLNARISYIMAENASLRQQMSGGGMPGMCPQPPPPPGMFPHPAMAYPWGPYPPYVLKPHQGSQVPLVPIPRLKPQQPTAPAPKARRSSESKTKKVASVSFLGLLFFVLLFGGLVPIVNVNFGGFDGNVPTTRLYDQHRGRVLTVDHGSNRSRENVVIRDKDKGSPNIPSNSTAKPLVASLYVPRNDKMVKIDGNLIIHSVLASERTKASLARLEMKDTETRLAIARNVGPSYGAGSGRRVPLYGNHAERQKALSSGSGDAAKERLKSSAADGRLQQWFREGLAGPMLSSGMCTEVFQFDVSPSSTSGAIVPASSVPNVSGQNTTQNTTRLSERSNRRALQRLPVPDFNITDERSNMSSSPKDDFKGNRSVSSMVVSVLVDPREAGDGADIEGMVKPKSLSRIFVVVLIDSVKYVTYSCVLPRAAPHLVTA